MLFQASQIGTCPDKWLRGFSGADFEKFVTRIQNTGISSAGRDRSGQIACAAVSTLEPTSPLPGDPGRRRMPGQVAAAVIGVHALACAVLAVFFPLVAATGASLSTTSHVMFSLSTFLFAVGLGLVARGLWRGASWSRTATFVWLVLLLPVGWAMFQAGSGLAGWLILASALGGIAAVVADARSAR